MNDRIRLGFVAFYILATSFFKKNFTRFENIFDNEKAYNKKFSVSESFRMVLIVQRLSKILKLKSCFTKTVAFRRCLNLSGTSSTVYIGVKRDGGIFKSHCWLESTNFKTEDLNNKKDFKILRTIE